MKNSYLFDIVSVLTPQERKSFLHFLDSPFSQASTKSIELRLLFQKVVSSIEAPSEEELVKEQLYEELFPNAPFVEGKLEKLMAELTKQLRTFGIISTLFSPEEEESLQLAWIAWLRKRGLGNRFVQAVSKLNKDLKQGEKDSIKYYKTSFGLAEEAHFWDISHNKMTGDLHIPTVLDQLDAYFYNLKIDYLNRLLVQLKTAKLPIQSLHEFEIPKQLNNPLFQISIQIHQIFRKEEVSVQDFETLINLIKENESYLSFDTLKYLYTHLRSLCTTSIDDGKTELVPTLHELHKTFLDKGYIEHNNLIHSSAYLNFVQIAVRAKDTPWARNFTETFKNQIYGGDEEQVFYKINISTCLFTEGKFQEAIDRLPDLPSNSFYHLIARRLELKAYYELRSDLLSYKIDAFRKFLERTAPKAISENVKSMNLNFAHMLAQLNQSPLKNAKRSVQLIARINTKKHIADRSWLIEKAQELA